LTPRRSGREAAGAPLAASDPEAGYYQAVEEFFVSRRGDPLFLSNADWLLIRKWRRAGIPLRVVLRGIGDALESHAVSWGRQRKVGSLAYCASEVEAARARWERALALGGETPDGASADAFLRGYAAGLETATLGAHAGALAPALAQRLRQRAGTLDGTAALERWLVQEETALLAALRADLPAAEWGQLEAEVDLALAPYGSRMPAKVLAQVRAESLSRRLLEVHGLARLSLFHL
jgi:hypothetical protein